MTSEAADAVLRVLLDRGLVSRAAAVDGDVLCVSDAARGWVRLIEKPRAQFFVRAGDAAAREGKLFARMGAQRFLPAVRIAEPELFVAEGLADTLNGIELHRVTRRVADWLPAAIGRALAAVHASAAGEGIVARELPAVLRGGDPGLAAPAVAQAVARVASQWQGDALLHGDAALERIFSAPDGAREIQLVDWSDARHGDPAWDLGAVIESYYAWALDPKIVSDVEGPVCPLSAFALAAALVALRDSYSAAARLSAAESRARLVRAFAYAGVRLIARVNRALRKPEPVTPQLTQMMQASIALMTAPATAADSFFAPPRPAWQQPWGAW
jgi:aminoglycoside phosphotransferase (APT) family kinase protein